MSDRPAPSSPRPLRGPALDALRELADLVVDPWIDQTPLRLYNAEQLAERLEAEGATIVICEADKCAGPVLDLPLVAIGSTRGDPTNVDVDGGHRQGHPRAAGARPQRRRRRRDGRRPAVRGQPPPAPGRPRRPRRRGLPRRHDPLPALPGVAARGPDRRARRPGRRGPRHASGGSRGSACTSSPTTPTATTPPTRLDELLAEADVVSMHAAVTPETLAMMGDEAVRRRCATARCTSTPHAPGCTTSTPSPPRSQSGKLAGAGLDHFEGEMLADGSSRWSTHGQRRAHAAHRRGHLRHRGQPHQAHRRRPRRAAAGRAAGEPARTQRSADRDHARRTCSTRQRSCSHKGLVEGTSGNVSGRVGRRAHLPHAVVDPVRDDDPRRPGDHRRRRQQARGPPRRRRRRRRCTWRATGPSPRSAA